jgi:hypothetical protein
MALDPDSLKLLAEKMDSLSTRFDAYVEQCRADDDDDEDEWLDPPEELTPSEERPWYGDGEERESLRQGSLSKGDK